MDEKGFSLIEMILMIVILAIALVGLVSALSFSTSRGVNAEVASTASALTQERMEELIAEKRANGFSSAALAVTVPAPLFIAVPGFAGYTRQTEICNAIVTAGSPGTITKTTPCDGAGTAGYKYITITVRYTGLASPIDVDSVLVITDT